MLTKAVAETPSVAIREFLAGCGLRFILNHRLRLRLHLHLRLRLRLRLHN